MYQFDVVIMWSKEIARLDLRNLEHGWVFTTPTLVSVLVYHTDIWKENSRYDIHLVHVP